MLLLLRVCCNSIILDFSLPDVVDVATTTVKAFQKAADQGVCVFKLKLFREWSGVITYDIALQFSWIR